MSNNEYDEMVTELEDLLGEDPNDQDIDDDIFSMIY